MILKAIKKNMIYKILFFVLIIITGGCNDPVFYTISQEVEPIDPLIDGSPGNFIINKYNNSIYVASGSLLWEYHNNNGNAEKYEWKKNDSLRKMNVKILQLAATDNYFYALCFKDSKKGISYSLWRFKGADSGNWEEVILADGVNRVNAVFAAGGLLFINTGVNGDYAVYCINDEDPDAKWNNINLNAEITGVSFDTSLYYISTRGNGIFYSENPETGFSGIDTDNADFIGILNMGNTANTIAAIARNGDLYTNKTVKTVFANEENITMGNHSASGAFAVWEKTSDGNLRRLLLVGRRDRLQTNINSGYTFGYLEIEYNDDGSFVSEYIEPGLSSVSTVESGDNDRYKSTIGKISINHLIQGPDGIVFASTQQKGVWSYRERKGLWQWNAEE